MQKSAGIDIDDLSTPFLDLTRIFFGCGGVQANRSFVRIFVIGTLFGAFFFNSIFSGNLFNSFTNESENEIDTFEKLSKANYTYYCDDLLKSQTDVINDTIRNITGLAMSAESAKPRFFSDLILTNKMPFAHILADFQIESLKNHFGHLVDITIIPDTLCMESWIVYHSLFSRISFCFCFFFFQQESMYFIRSKAIALTSSPEI